MWLADEKIIYTRRILKPEKPSHELESVSDFTSDLLELALLSGEHSRFRLDPVLSHRFRDLYEEWLRKSLDRRIADEVFSFQGDENHSKGFITLKAHPDSVVVGLIAVDPEEQGKNIGSSLMRSTENWAFERGLENVNVATQKRNSGACRFYERNGYHIDSIQYIYHYHHG
jgi:dTDP-4-amino-4,6-dideoxy-D-galactose acyltransferase